MHRSKWFKFTVTALLIGTAGFMAGNKYSTFSTPVSSPPPVSNLKKDAIFQEQNAVIDGEITKTEGSTVSVKNKTGDAASFQLSPQAVIYKIKDNQQVATPSSDLQAIELNKPAYISLKLVDNQYLITSINYLVSQFSAAASTK